MVIQFHFPVTPMGNIGELKSCPTMTMKMDNPMKYNIPVKN